MSAPATSGRPRRSLRVAAGVAVAALGVVLVLRPFSSLAVLVTLVGLGLILTGVAAVVDHRHHGATWPWVFAVVWVVAGVAVLAWPAVSVRALAVVAGASLIVGGALDVIAGVRGRRDERVVAVLGGAASAVIGVLALVWPDVTVLVVAVVFGARLVVLGLRMVWRAATNRHQHQGATPVSASAFAPPPPSGSLRRGLHVIAALAMLLVALVLAAVSVLVNRAEPLLDAFYDVPAELPAEPGCWCAANRSPGRSPTGRGRGGSSTPPRSPTVRQHWRAGSSWSPSTEVGTTAVPSRCR